MAKLKPGAIGDLKPARLKIELFAARPRPRCLRSPAREIAQGTIEPAKPIAPLLGRFMASDRAFAKARRIT